MCFWLELGKFNALHGKRIKTSYGAICLVDYNERCSDFFPRVLTCPGFEINIQFLNATRERTAVVGVQVFYVKIVSLGIGHLELITFLWRAATLLRCSLGAGGFSNASTNLALSLTDRIIRLCFSIMSTAAACACSTMKSLTDRPSSDAASSISFLMRGVVRAARRSFLVCSSSINLAVCICISLWKLNVRQTGVQCKMHFYISWQRLRIGGQNAHPICICE